MVCPGQVCSRRLPGLLSSKASFQPLITPRGLKYLLRRKVGNCISRLVASFQSSLRIVPVATASFKDASTGLKSSTVKVSFGSRVRSDLMLIVIVWLETPG